MPHIKKDDRSKEQKQQEVLAAFERYANISRACRKVKVDRRTFYYWLEEEGFKKEYEKSEKIALGVLEDEATRRAIEGTLKPVYYLGQKVGSIREYSDTLTIVLLKARAPQKYKDRIANEHTGADGKPIEIKKQVVHVHSNIPLASTEDDIAE